MESQMKKLRQQSDQLEQQAIQQISRVLTRQQRLAFDRMLGQPFRLDVPKGSAGLGAGASPKDDGKARRPPIRRRRRRLARRKASCG